MTDNTQVPGTVFGHPVGLAVCFLTEMWERFSYYGMRALLIFYLTQHFLFTDQVAAGIFGAYISLVYITPVIGGIIADRYLGPGKAVIAGCVFLVAGHFGMAIEGPPTTATGQQDGFYLQFFYISLGLIITGVGFIKANISTIVGTLYEKHDKRRDGAYTLFYMGINLGAFAGALICGLLLEFKGFSWGFGAAGFGMLFGLLIFLRGRRYLGGADAPPDIVALRARTRLGFTVETLVYLGAVASVVLLSLLLRYYHLVGGLLIVFLSVMIGIILWHALARCTKIDRDKLLVCLFLMTYQVIFWALFEQAGSSINLLTDRNIDRHIFGMEIPAAAFQSINALFIILLAPLFSMAWSSLGNRNREPSTPVKFALALIQVGIGFLLLVFGATNADDPTRIAVIWLLLMYLLHTSGELCISPIGLSMTTKLSTPNIVGMMMGCWFLAMAAGNFVSGIVAGLTGSGAIDPALAVTPELALQTYLDVYSLAGYLSITVGALALFIAPVLVKRMHGVR